MIRKAESKDLARIAEILVFNYRLYFYPIFQSDEYYFSELQVPAIMKNLETALDSLYVYDDGVVKGFIKIEGTYIARLYVEPVLQNAAIGSKLLEYAVNEHHADHLWALEKNVKAIRFYERHGFVATGEKKLEEGTTEYLILMRKKKDIGDIFKCDLKDMPVVNNIYQLTDAPDLVTSGDGDKYIGYEHIGGAYSGNMKYSIWEGDALFADHLAEVTGDGIFLDLACGDGCFTVPCAKHGTRIIAGDISNGMLTILQERAKRNDVSLENVTLCRMNALEIPLKDESVDCVVANSMLHLISNPQKVLDEIYRVLKPGGRFLCLSDAPARKGTAISEYEKENAEYSRVVGEIYDTYWEELKAYDVHAKRYSWKFDRESACKAMFREVENKVIERGWPYTGRLVDKFLPRFEGRGFSDQVDVPPEIHKAVSDKVVASAREKYGEAFENIAYHGIVEDLVITSYVK
ncbi:MAG: GNAT family N-acetyltransferase [Lachnospiraceae bacterium]|nr:GNAT family N-acetyltransferase [Lachnospiraceae bacterium]